LKISKVHFPSALPASHINLARQSFNINWFGRSSIIHIYKLLIVFPPSEPNPTQSLLKPSLSYGKYISIYVCIHIIQCMCKVGTPTNVYFFQPPPFHESRDLAAIFVAIRNIEYVRKNCLKYCFLTTYSTLCYLTLNCSGFVWENNRIFWSRTLLPNSLVLLCKQGN
jgi:hypothetical protein